MILFPCYRRNVLFHKLKIFVIQNTFHSCDPEPPARISLPLQCAHITHKQSLFAFILHKRDETIADSGNTPPQFPVNLLLNYFHACKLLPKTTNIDISHHIIFQPSGGYNMWIQVALQIWGMDRSHPIISHFWALTCMEATLFLTLTKHSEFNSRFQNSFLSFLTLESKIGGFLVSGAPHVLIVRKQILNQDNYQI